MEVNSGVETLCSILKGKPPLVEVIHHKSKKQINRSKKNNFEKSNVLNSKTDENINLRKLQNEIFKFTTHFDSQNTKAKEHIAIKLGAKPRKKECLNYKQLKEKLKQDSEAKKNQEQLLKLPKTMVRTSKTNKRKINMKTKNHFIDIIKNYGTIKNKK